MVKEMIERNGLLGLHLLSGIVMVFLNPCEDNFNIFWKVIISSKY